MISFHKAVGGDFDRIDISSNAGSDWVTLEMRVGHDVERIRMTLRDTEAVYDLHYALGRYLTRLEEHKARRGDGQ
jgi:hypothetical protein